MAANVNSDLPCQHRTILPPGPSTSSLHHILHPQYQNESSNKVKQLLREIVRVDAITVISPSAMDRFRLEHSAILGCFWDWCWLTPSGGSLGRKIKTTSCDSGSSRQIKRLRWKNQVKKYFLRIFSFSIFSAYLELWIT